MVCDPGECDQCQFLDHPVGRRLRSLALLGQQPFDLAPDGHICAKTNRLPARPPLLVSGPQCRLRAVAVDDVLFAEPALLVSKGVSRHIIGLR